jgi:YHS domain-containing protein
VSETILYLIAGVLILGVLLSVIRVVLKGVAEFFGTAASPPGPGPAGPRAGSTPPLPTSEALKRDPVCGTYLAPSTAVQKKVGGVTYYFCSPECREKFRAAG